MATAKKPQDHLPKKPAVKEVEGGKRVTLRGVTVTVLNEALDDWELLEEIDRLESGQVQKMPSLLRRLVGDDYQLVMDTLRGKSGRVTVGDAAEFLTDLFGALNPN